jgi:hypothetical protein
MENKLLKCKVTKKRKRNVTQSNVGSVHFLELGVSKLSDRCFLGKSLKYFKAPWEREQTLGALVQFGNPSSRR